MDDEALQDRCRGVLLGLAAGDRNGGPVRMAVRLAEGLAERGALDPADVLGRYLRWWHEGAFDTGPVAGRALELLASGVPSDEAAARVHRELGGRTAGCNPAHRSAPLAMLAAIPEGDLPRHAAAEAALKHLHPLAGDVAAVVNVLCRSLVRGSTWEAALARAGQGRETATREALLAGRAGPGGRGGYAPEALRAAVFFVTAAADFTEALDGSTEFAGPANYCPVLAGAIAGARWGASAISGKALAHCSVRDRVRAAADQLASGWASSR